MFANQHFVMITVIDHLANVYIEEIVPFDHVDKRRSRTVAALSFWLSRQFDTQADKQTEARHKKNRKNRQRCGEVTFLDTQTDRQTNRQTGGHTDI